MMRLPAEALVFPVTAARDGRFDFARIRNAGSVSGSPWSTLVHPIRAFVGTAAVFGIGPQQYVGTIAEALRHGVHGDAAVEQGGCVGDPQIVKPQPGETELARYIGTITGMKTPIAP
jgi:hypothetical protein